MTNASAVAAPPSVPSRVESRAATALLIALTAIAPMSVDMFLPSMPDMAREFDTSTASVSLAVTLFLLAFAGSQLVFGPASDRYGRRPALFAGLAMYVAASVACLFAPSVQVLLVARVVQGFGGGAGPAIARAIVVDVYRGERATRILAVMTVAIALAPMLAPIVGGVLHDVAGWHSVFVVLTAIGILLTVAYAWMMPETLREPDPRALRARRMAANYRTLYGSRTFASYSLLMGLLFSGQLVFISSSSFVLIDELGMPAGLFGLGFGFVSFGIMTGAALSRRLTGAWEPARIIRTASMAGAVATVLMALTAMVGFSGPLLIVLPMFVFALGNGMARPPAMASALLPFPMMAGLASAVLGFTQIALASLYSMGYNGFVTPSSESMTAAIAVASLAALGLVLLARPAAQAAHS